MDSTDSARVVNTLLNLALEYGGGYIPPAGVGHIGAKSWAKLLDVEPDTIRAWVDKYEIENLNPGRLLLIKPEWMASRLPHQFYGRMRAEE